MSAPKIFLRLMKIPIINTNLEKTFHQDLNLPRQYAFNSSFLFTTNETMRDYYLKNRYIRLASRVAEPLKTQGLRKLRNIRNVLRLTRIIA